MKDIPVAIKAARLRCGYTQQELGEMMGYTRESAIVTARRRENGTRPVPIDKIRPFAAALNLTLDDLIP